MSRSLQEPKRALTELQFVPILDFDMGELRTGSRADIDLRSGAFRKFAVSRHEVGMDVSLDDVFDLPPFAGCRLEVDVDIALGIDDSREAIGPDHVGGVGQTAQIESLDLYRFHAYSPIHSLLRLGDDAQIGQNSVPPRRVFLLRVVV